MASGSGVEKNALNNSANAVTQANGAYNTVNPIYTAMAEHPTGYTPQQKANLNTASMESVGGSVAGAVGQGNLEAARTNNAGGYTAALDDAARGGMVQNSENALGVQNQDAQLATQNQRIGLNGLNGIYQDANQTGEGYLNTANSASQAAANRKMGYVKMGLQTAGALGGA